MIRSRRVRVPTLRVQLPIIALAMPPGTRSSQPTQPTRTRKGKQGRRGARDSEDEPDETPTNTQGIDEDDDLNQPRGVNNEVGRAQVLTILKITKGRLRKQITKLGILFVLPYSQKTVECL